MIKALYDSASTFEDDERGWGEDFLTLLERDHLERDLLESQKPRIFCVCLIEGQCSASRKKVFNKPEGVQQIDSLKPNGASLIGLLSEHGDTWFSDQPRIERNPEYCPGKENSEALSSIACQHAATVQAYESGSSENATYCHIEESWPDDDDDNGEALLNEESGGSKSAKPAAKHAPKGQQEVLVAQKGAKSAAQAKKQSRDTQLRAGAKRSSGSCKGKRFACQKASLQRGETADKKVLILGGDPMVHRRQPAKIIKRHQAYNHYQDGGFEWGGDGSGLDAEVANEGWEGVGHISLGHD